MDPDKAQEAAEREHLWANLTKLRPIIDTLAAGMFTGTAQERQSVQVLALVIITELKFRERDATVSGS